MAWADACCVCQLTSKAQTTNTDIFWLLKNTQKDSEFFPSRCQCNLHILKHSSTFLLESPQTHPLQKESTAVALRYLGGALKYATVFKWYYYRALQRTEWFPKTSHYIQMLHSYGNTMALYLGNTCTNTIRT